MTTSSTGPRWRRGFRVRRPRIAAADSGRLATEATSGAMEGRPHAASASRLCAAARHQTFGGGGVAGWPILGSPGSAEGVVELAPDRLGMPRHRVASDEARRAPRVGPAVASNRSRPASFSARRPARMRPSGPCVTRRACRIASASSRSGRDRRAAAPRRADDEAAERAIARVEDAGRVRRWRTRAGGAPGPHRSRRRRARPSPPGRAARTAGSAGRPASSDGSPGASRMRYQVWTSKPSRSYIGWPADVATRTSVRQPAASAASIVARVSSSPTPCRRQSGSTKIVPIQATGPLRLATPVPTTSAVGVGDERLRLGMAGDELEVEPAVAPVLAQEEVDDRVDVGRDHGPDAGQLHAPMVAGRRLSSTAMATLSRSDVEHVAHLARLGLTDAELRAARGRAEPHPRPVRHPGRARHRRHPADGADHRAREHPAGRRRPAVAAGRGGPRQRTRSRRRLHRRSGHPRRALSSP